MSFHIPTNSANQQIKLPNVPYAKKKPSSVTTKTEIIPNGVEAQLQISSAEASDSGAYFCQASNLYGRDQQLVQLLVQGTLPEALHLLYIYVTKLLTLISGLPCYSIRATPATARPRDCDDSTTKYKRQMAAPLPRLARSYKVHSSV